MSKQCHLIVNISLDIFGDKKTNISKHAEGLEKSVKPDCAESDRLLSTVGLGVIMNISAKRAYKNKLLIVCERKGDLHDVLLGLRMFNNKIKNRTVRGSRKQISILCHPHIAAMGHL